MLAHSLGRQQSRQSRHVEFRRDLLTECRNRLRNSYLGHDITEGQYIARMERIGYMTTGGLCELVIELRTHDRHLYRRLSEEPSTWRI